MQYGPMLTQIGIKIQSFPLTMLYSCTNTAHGFPRYSPKPNSKTKVRITQKRPIKSASLLETVKEYLNNTRKQIVNNNSNVTVESCRAASSPKQLTYHKSLAVPFSIARNNIGNHKRKYFIMILVFRFNYLGMVNSVKLCPLNLQIPFSSVPNQSSPFLSL